MEKPTNSATSEDSQKTTKPQAEDKSAKTKNIVAKDEEGVKLSDEQWEQVFQHPTFKKLNEKAKTAQAELDEIKKEKEKEAQKKLKEEGKYQELLEAKEKEIESIRSNLSETLLNNEVISIASKLKVLDTEAVVKLIDRDKLETDKDGKYLNTEEVVKDLLNSKPYLVGATANESSNIGSGVNTTTDSQNGDFVMTKSELQARLKDHNWYTENKDKIEVWQKEGRIDYSK